MLLIISISLHPLEKDCNLTCMSERGMMEKLNKILPPSPDKIKMGILYASENTWRPPGNKAS